jgi:hypothetical protein
MQVSHFFEVKLRPWDVVSAGVFISQDLMASPMKMKEKKTGAPRGKDYKESDRLQSPPRG